MGVSGPGSAGLWTGRRRSEAERNGAEVAPRPSSSRGGRRRKARGYAAPSSLGPDLGLAASNLHSPSTYVARCPGGVSCGTMAWQCSTVPFGPRGLFPAVVAGVGRGWCPSGDAVAMRDTEHASFPAVYRGYCAHRGYRVYRGYRQRGTSTGKAMLAQVLNPIRMRGEIQSCSNPNQVARGERCEGRPGFRAGATRPIPGN